jgi:hypothetical protein
LKHDAQIPLKTTKFHQPPQYRRHPRLSRENCFADQGQAQEFVRFLRKGKKAIEFTQVFFRAPCRFCRPPPVRAIQFIQRRFGAARPHAPAQRPPAQNECTAARKNGAIYYAKLYTYSHHASRRDSRPQARTKPMNNDRGKEALNAQAKASLRADLRAKTWVQCA